MLAGLTLARFTRMALASTSRLWSKTQMASASITPTLWAVFELDQRLRHGRGAFLL